MTDLVKLKTRIEWLVNIDFDKSDTYKFFSESNLADIVAGVAISMQITGENSLGIMFDEYCRFQKTPSFDMFLN